MTQTVMKIEQFDPRNATESEFVVLHAFTSRMRTEFLPDEPLTPLDEAIAA